MQSTAPSVSIIIPAYNEARRLPGTLTRIAAFVSSSGSAAEVLVVDDGSSDQTARIVSECAARHDYIVLESTAHQGKGHAVKTGIMRARGTVLLVMDADLSVSIEQAWRFIPHDVREDYIAIGSREVAGACRIGEPAYRHVTGIVFNRLVHAVLGLHMRDTQCGCKCFHRTLARRLCALQTLNGWGFDVELLYLAARMGCCIHEIPVTWRYDGDSRVNVLRDSWAMFGEVMRIKWNALRGVYGV